MPSSPKTICTVLVLALLTAACGSGDSDDSGPPFGTAQTRPAGRSLVPDDAGPSGVALEAVGRDSAFGGVAGGDAWLAVYGDPSAEDPLEGPVLGVAVQQGREDSPSLFMPEANASSARVQGQRGQVYDDVTSTWVSWALPDEDQETDYAAVVGRRLQRDVVRSVAEAVDVRVEPSADGATETSIDVPADALPSDLVLLAEGPVSLAGFAQGSPGIPHSTYLAWQGSTGSSVRTQAVVADPALELLLRFGIDDPGGTVIRGHRGAAGHPMTGPYRRAEPQPVYRTWQEDGLVMFIRSAMVDTAEVEAFVDGLRPSGDQDWTRFTDLVLQADPEPMVDTDLVLSGTFGTGRWAFGLRRRGEAVTLEHRIDLVDGSSGGHGIATVPLRLTVGVERLEQGTLVYGFGPAGTGRVTLSLAGGSTWEPDLEELDPSGSERFFAQWLDEQIDVVSATAYDTRGAVTARADARPGRLPDSHSFTAPAR